LSTLPSVPHLSYEQLRSYADGFLKRYHPTKKIPVPIEQIVEFQLKLDIIPLPGLQAAYEIAGFTSGELTAISVDQFVYEHRPRRYRFTLAHEVGHVVLHAELFKEHSFRTVDEWKRFVRAFPDLDLSRLEWQAHCFAGLVLVPREVLAETVQDKVRQMKVQKLQQEKDFARDLIIEKLADHFDVSNEVIERRLNHDQVNLLALWL